MTAHPDQVFYSGRVVHLSAEYWPFVRTGGLGEAVRGLAEYQAKARIPVTTILPLHRAVRQSGARLEPVGEPFDIQVGTRREKVRIHRAREDRGEPQVLFVEHASFDRPKVYGTTSGDYPDNHWRFACFCYAALAALPRVAPDTHIVHAHDWHTAIAMAYLRNQFAGNRAYDRIGAVLTMHNPAFQGHYPKGALAEVGLASSLYDWRFFEWHGQVNFLKGGTAFADMVTTVSPTHAKELRTTLGGFGLHEHFQWLGDRLVGILNGVDVERWNPATDTDITARFSRKNPTPKMRCKRGVQRQFQLPQRKRTPLIAISARLVKQKGLDLVLADGLMADLSAQLIVLGHGHAFYEAGFTNLAAKFPNKVSFPLDFSERLEHRLLAGADMLLMPSQFEPCGLTQMRAQRYGTLPVVRRVGGLADTVQDGVNGFSFDEFEPAALAAALHRAIATYRTPARWADMVDNAMACDHSWAKAELHHRDVYRSALAARA